MIINKAKKHLSDHKDAYLVLGTAAVVAGFTVVIMRRNYSVVPRVTDADMQSVSARTFSFSFFMKDSGNAVTTVHTGARGHPGFVIRCLETGQLFPSQNSAAKAFDGWASVLSGHLSGKLSDFQGFHFERVFVD